MYKYRPTELHLGKLPETDGEIVSLDVRAKLAELGVTNAKEFLIYTFVTTRDDSAKFQRGYYVMFTSENEDKYKKYMNVATGPGVTTIDSANLWFPIGDDGKLTITLSHAGSKTRSIKCPDAGEQWSDVYLTGYRN